MLFAVMFFVLLVAVSVTVAIIMVVLCTPLACADAAFTPVVFVLRLDIDRAWFYIARKTDVDIDTCCHAGACCDEC